MQGRALDGKSINDEKVQKTLPIIRISDVQEAIDNYERTDRCWRSTPHAIKQLRDLQRGLKNQELSTVELSALIKIIFSPDIEKNSFLVNAFQVLKVKLKPEMTDALRIFASTYAATPADLEFIYKNPNQAKTIIEARKILGPILNDPTVVKLVFTDFAQTITVSKKINQVVHDLMYNNLNTSNIRDFILARIDQAANFADAIAEMEKLILSIDIRDHDHSIKLNIAKKWFPISSALVADLKSLNSALRHELQFKARQALWENMVKSEDPHHSMIKILAALRINQSKGYMTDEQVVGALYCNTHNMSKSYADFTHQICEAPDQAEEIARNRPRPSEELLLQSQDPKILHLR